MLAVEITHEVIWRNDYYPGFGGVHSDGTPGDPENGAGNGGYLEAEFEVWEGEDPETFEYDFPCITD